MHAIPSCNEVHRVVVFWIRRISCLFHIVGSFLLQKFNISPLLACRWFLWPRHRERTFLLTCWAPVVIYNYFCPSVHVKECLNVSIWGPQLLLNVVGLHDQLCTFFIPSITAVLLWLQHLRSLTLLWVALFLVADAETISPPNMDGLEELLMVR